MVVAFLLLACMKWRYILISWNQWRFIHIKGKWYLSHQVVATLPVSPPHTDTLSLLSLQVLQVLSLLKSSQLRVFGFEKPQCFPPVATTVTGGRVILYWGGGGGRGGPGREGGRRRLDQDNSPTHLTCPPTSTSTTLLYKLEEFNRYMLSKLSTFHFTCERPTEDF